MAALAERAHRWSKHLLIESCFTHTNHTFDRLECRSQYRTSREDPHDDTLVRLRLMQVPEGSGKDLHRITEKRSNGSGELDADSRVTPAKWPRSPSCAIEPLSQDRGPLSAS